MTEDNKPSASAMTAFGEKITELEEALNLLYIAGNASGRHKFREKWPDIAAYIFCADLTRYDEEGLTAEQREHRAELEEAANQRRIAFKNNIPDILKNSVKDTVLQKDYINEIIARYDDDIAQILYAPETLRRVRPDLLDDQKPEKASPPAPENLKPIETTPAPTPEAEPQEEQKLSKVEKYILSNKSNAPSPEDLANLKPVTRQGVDVPNTPEEE